MQRFLAFWRGAAPLEALFGEVSARARLALLGICLAAAGFVSLYVLHFAHRDEVERYPGSLPGWSALEQGEYALLDRRFAARGELMPRSRDSIAIVGIDQASLDATGEWPWPRSLHARLVERLHRAGARVIVLDIGFNEYSNPVIDAKTGARSMSKGDEALVKAVERAGNVLVVSRVHPHEEEASKHFRDDTESQIVTPFEELDALTPDLAVNYVKLDTDGGARRSPLRMAKPPETAPLGGIAPLGAAMFQGLVKGEDLEVYQAHLRAGTWPDASGKLHRVPTVEHVLSGGPNLADRTRAWTTPLWFWGPQKTFPTHSYHDVLENWDNTKLKKHFAGRLVFVGGTATILKDVFPSPDFKSGARAQIPGVEVHATMAAMLLDGAYLHTQSTPSALWTLLVLTVLGSLWTAFLCRQAAVLAQRAQAKWAAAHRRGRIYAPLWIGMCLVFGPLPIYAFWEGAKWAFSAHHLWIIALYPCLGAILSSGATFLLLFVTESSGRRKVMTQMSRLVAPDVMEEILAHPEEDYPRSRRVHATVLFSDLEGFTSYSESRQPEEVVAALNLYFTRMRPIVDAHGGSVDKYIGDSIMAFFGAPIPRADHAARALRCAIAMQDECARFREETGIPFWMRTGVHTGDLIVGSVGDQTQFNYTAIGDAVNLASRLEATNKAFGSRIICSADTQREAPDVANAERSQTPIRGKSGDVEIFIVRGPFGQAPREGLWGHGDLAIDWDAAAEERGGYRTRASDLKSEVGMERDG